MCRYDLVKNAEMEDHSGSSVWALNTTKYVLIKKEEEGDLKHTQKRGVQRDNKGRDWSDTATS